MAALGRLWAGHAYGTNTGNLFALLQQDGDAVTGTIRFLDSLAGLAIYDVTGEFKLGKLTLGGKSKNSPRGAEPADISLRAVLSRRGELHGEWSTTTGGAGTFELRAHEAAAANQADGPPAGPPAQIHARSETIGAVRLYGQDLRNLIDIIRRDFVVGCPVVTYEMRSTEITRFADDFLADAPNLEELLYLKISIAEPEANGVDRTVIVEFSSYGSNTIRVSGLNESWVTGKCEMIRRYMRKFESTSITSYKRFGANMRILLVLVLLVAIPEIEMWRWRAVFIAVVVILFGSLVWLHGHLIPNAVIHPSERQPGVLARSWPNALSWILNATASLAAAWAFYVLTRTD